jgi:DNA polymerase-1
MKVYLIDANALIYRIYHAMPKLTDSNGRPVQALYGLANSLLKFLKDEKPDYIFALFDRPEPTIRHQVFKEYKATRPKATEDLKLQISLSKKIFSAFNIPVIEKIGYEADDLIASLKEKFINIADEIIIVTGDLDTLQLVDAKTKVLTMQKGISKTIIYDEKKIKERYGLSPCQLCDFKALTGDVSDNIIGISGIGPKTASWLLQKYNNIEGILNAIKKGEISNKISSQILNNKEKIFFNRDLITLRNNIDIDENLINTYKGYDQKNLISVFQEFGFKSLIDRLSLDIKPSLSKSLFSDQVLNNDSLFNKDQPTNNFTKINNFSFLFFDEGEIKAYNSNNEVLILDQKLIKDFFYLDVEKYVFDLKNILKKILKEDFYFDKKIDLKKIYDLQLIFWLLNPDKGHYSLKEIISFSSYLSPIQITQNLILKLKDLGLEKIYYDIELPLVAILARMEIRGIKINLDALKEFKNEVSSENQKLLNEIHNLAGEKFNPNSTVQLRKILFDKLKLPTKGLSKTSKGEISTQEVDLIKIANLHPIINLILEYRQINKLLTTYINSLFLNYDSNTKRIFTNFNQTATTTGRIVSQNPNLQNLPLEGKLANSLRKCFVSEEGYYFVRADYSQIELRLLAHLSKDEALKAAFENNLDLHLQTAKMIFGEADQETRRKAKIINFSIIYGASAKTLSEKLQVPISEANKLIEKFFYFYPGVKKLKEDLIEFAKTYGYVQTVFGRKRFIPEINYQSYREKSFAERIAVNMPIQGLAADIFKKAMIEIDKEIYQNNLPAFFTLAIHDELVFEVKDEVKEEFADIIKKKMENVYSLDVPLVVNLSISNYLSSK